MHTKRPALMRLPLRKNLLSRLVGAFVYRQSLNFCQREVPGVIATVRSCPAREPLRYIGHAVEVYVVEHDELVIARRNDILLQVIRAHRISQRFCLQGVLREVARSAAMRDNDRSHILL